MTDSTAVRVNVPPTYGVLRGAGRHQCRRIHANHPGFILDLRGGVAGSYLSRWADLLLRSGLSPGAGRRAWADVSASLSGSHRDVGEALVSSVWEIGRNDRRTVGLDAFVAGVDQPRRPSRGQHFDAAHFTTTPRAGRPQDVAIHAPAEARIGQSRVYVLVQLSEALAPWDFALTERS